ncbi:uncharacterized protein involved in response to NO [Haloferula luteola]|uniref:Uncharacterized protein involved in response to NO n=1 Tax=Haloferula luteola TaxID=595692 RepID=A0A840V966_9BACT|nr:uncharacterized protein involved in response to NO [Haloferula luteola]
MKIEPIAREPHRVFFPLGIVLSVLGVALWPLHFCGWIDGWPMEAHARFMVLGFGGCFIAGFMGTAGPRMTGAFPWSCFECLLFISLISVMAGLWWFQQISVADGVGGFWLIGLTVSLVVRGIVGRSKLPPPGLFLVAAGWGGAAMAEFALALDVRCPLDPTWRTFWRLMLFQGFLWLPLMGLIPLGLSRFWGQTSVHVQAQGNVRSWLRTGIPCWLAGGILIFSIALEAMGSGRLGMVLRVVAVTLAFAFALAETGWRKSGDAGEFALRWVPAAAAVGWLAATALPPLRIGLLHAMFIGAAGGAVLSVATRVVLGQARGTDSDGRPMKGLKVVWGLLLFTAATRWTPEFVPKIRISHFNYAALVWSGTLVFWSWRLRSALVTAHKNGSRKHRPLSRGERKRDRDQASA